MPFFLRPYASNQSASPISWACLTRYAAETNLMQMERRPKRNHPLPSSIANQQDHPRNFDHHYQTNPTVGRAIAMAHLRFPHLQFTRVHILMMHSGKTYLLSVVDRVTALMRKRKDGSGMDPPDHRERRKSGRRRRKGMNGGILWKGA